MTPRGFATAGFASLAAILVATAATLVAIAATLVAIAPLAAQEIVELSDRDERMDADFEEVFRVGARDGESWEIFASVVGVGFDARGNLFVFDAVGAGVDLPGLIGTERLRVLVFDVSGDFVREFGSSGEGPGEFKIPTGFTVMRNGTTVVNDVGHDAYQLFDESGTFVRMVRTPDALGMVSAIQDDPRGGAVFTESGGMTIGGGGDGGPPTSRSVMRLELGGEVVHADTVADGWLPPRPKPTDLGKLFGLGAITMPAVFEPELLLGVLPDGGIVHSDSSAYALKVTPPDASEVVRIIRRPFHPEPFTPAIKKAYEAQQAAKREERSRRGWRSLGGFEPAFYPDLPVIRSLATTWEGRIWVQRRGEELEDGGPVDVLTAEGDYLGTFPADATEMPDAFGPYGMVAFIELDEFDVASVVVRKLPAAIR